MKHPAVRWGLLLCLSVVLAACVDGDRVRLAAALEASRARADLLALSLALEQAAGGNPDGFASVRQIEPLLQARMLTLRESGTAAGNDASNVPQRDSMDRAWLIWSDVRNDLQQLMVLEAARLDALASMASLSALLPELQSRLEGLLQVRTEGSESTQVLRCMLMVERMQRRVHQLIASTPGRQAAVDGLARDTADLVRCLDLLRGPRPALDLKPVGVEIEETGTPGVASLPTDVQINTQVDALVGVAGALLELDALTERLRQAVEKLARLLDELAADR